MMPGSTCPRCNKPMQPNWKTCPFCGQPLLPAQPLVSPPQQPVYPQQQQHGYPQQQQQPVGPQQQPQSMPPPAGYAPAEPQKRSSAVKWIVIAGAALLGLCLVCSIGLFAISRFAPEPDDPPVTNIKTDQPQNNNQPKNTQPQNPGIQINQPGTSSTAPRKPGYITGMVTDTSGKPLSEVKISVWGTTDAGERTNSFTTQTNSKGQYEVRVPNGIYDASAQYQVSYNNHPYSFSLAPADNKRGQRFDSQQGGVANFVWQLSGPLPEPGLSKESSYYGGYLKLSDEWWYIMDTTGKIAGDEVKLPNGSTVEFMLRPEGALLDGSQGKTLTMKTSIPWQSSDDRVLVDIPLGKYTVSAKLIDPTGATKPLRLAYKSNKALSKYATGTISDPASSVSIEFLPNTVTWGAVAGDLYVLR